MAQHLQQLQVTPPRKRQSDLGSGAHGAAVPQICVDSSVAVDTVLGQLDVVGRVPMARKLGVGQGVERSIEIRKPDVWDEYATHL